jgi:hypothetical protein
VRGLGLAGFLRGDVGDHRQRARVLAVPVEQRARRHQRPDLVPVLGAKRKREPLSHALSAKSQAAPRPFDVLLIYEAEQRLAEHLPGLVAEHLGQRGVDERRHVVRIGRPDPLAGRLEHDPGAIARHTLGSTEIRSS